MEPLTEFQSTASNVTFSLTVKHVGLLSDLSQRTGINKSELVRKAIELLYKRIDEIAAAEKQLDE